MPKIQKSHTATSLQQLETTAHYQVFTDSSDKTAKDIGVLLESLYNTYSGLLGWQENTIPLHVYAFADRVDYKSRVEELNLQQGSATGFYTPAKPAGIYLPLVKTSGEHPFFTLAHEGLHQYAHEQLGINIADSSAKLPAIPLWLNEGLALNMEAALVDDTNLQLGRLHRPRLEHLQKLINTGKAPSVKTVLDKTYGTPFTNADYSVAWGITYLLLTDSEISGHWQDFWSILHKELQEEATQLMKDITFSTSSDLIKLQTKWASQLQTIATRTFQNQVVDQGQSWSNWQKRWEESILQLTFEEE